MKVTEGSVTVVSPEECKANGKQCKKCLKSNHFPKSKNCSKTRLEMLKAKKKDQEIKESCQTLRSFLKSKNYHLSNVKIKIPYEELVLKSTCVKSDGNKLYTVPSFDARMIMMCIKLLEEKLNLINEIADLCFGRKTFLLFYLLVNMDRFLLQKSCNLKQEYSNEELLILQNLVNLNTKNKEDTTESNEEEKLSQKLQIKIIESKKLVNKFTNKLERIIRTDKGVDDLKVHDE